MSAVIYNTASFLKKRLHNRNIFATLVLFFFSGISVVASSISDTLQFRILISTDSSAVQTELQQHPEQLKSEFRLGTNLLYDVATVANLYFEVGFARHLAVNLSAAFSPWDIRRPDIKLRTLLIQPELRWYFGDNFKGHYLGVEGHYGWWNAAVGGKTRYQDRDGNTPLWGAGLSYGYSLAFNEHFGMDFGISAGYAKLNYDCFYNIENGAKFTTKTRDWWGPTRVGISIYYQF